MECRPLIGYSRELATEVAGVIGTRSWTVKGRVVRDVQLIKRHNRAFVGGRELSWQ